MATSKIKSTGKKRKAAPRAKPIHFNGVMPKPTVAAFERAFNVVHFGRKSFSVNDTLKVLAWACGQMKDWDRAQLAYVMVGRWLCPKMGQRDVVIRAPQPAAEVANA